MRKMNVEKLNLGKHMASCVGQPMFNYEEWKESGEYSEDVRYVMGYKLPSWQRLFVWTETQKIKLIESIWLGLNIGTYTFNRSYKNDSYDDLLIDGQQRMKPIEDYINNDFKVFGYYWSELTDVDHRVFSMMHFHCYITETEEENYLKNYYNLMNFGGTAHDEAQRA